MARNERPRMKSRTKRKKPRSMNLPSRTKSDSWEFRVQEESDLGKTYRGGRGTIPKFKGKSPKGKRERVPVVIKQASGQQVLIMAQPLSHRGDYEKGTEISVPSTAIFWAEYYEEQQILIIAFRVSGKYYTYYKVDLDTFKAFKLAPSKGRYFNKHIKTKFDFKPGAHRP